MSELANQSETKTIFVEKSLDYPGIRFEPGIHPTDPEEIENLFNRFAGGDLNVHIWNDEVLGRMRQYAPEVVAIDGQAPLSLKDEVVSPGSLWIGLPGKPSEINPITKEVCIVRGDINGFGYLFSRKGAEGVGKLMESQELKQYLDITRKSRGEALAKYSLGAVVLLAATGRLLSETKTNRRNFLRLIAAAGGLGMIASSSPPLLSFLASRSESSEAKDFFADLYNIFSRRFFKENIIDFRTALLIAKEEDAIDFLHKPKNVSGTVLVGSTHLSRANELMSSRSERLRTISSFTEILIGSLNLALEEHPSIDDRDELTKTLLNFISAVEVVKLTDPPVNSDGSFGPLTMIIMGTFQSPQVGEAISRYR